MTRLREFGWVLFCASLERLPGGGHFAIVSASGQFFETRRAAIRWIVRTGWAHAQDNVTTRRSLRAQGVHR